VTVRHRSSEKLDLKRPRPGLSFGYCSCRTRRQTWRAAAEWQSLEGRERLRLELPLVQIARGLTAIIRLVLQGTTFSSGASTEQLLCPFHQTSSNLCCQLEARNDHLRSQITRCGAARATASRLPSSVHNRPAHGVNWTDNCRNLPLTWFPRSPPR
jgi:hypothetical protein